MTYVRSRQYGGDGGGLFKDNLTETAFIRSVTICHGARIDSIQVTWWLAEGRYLQGARHGGPGGTPHTFTLESDEYITTISGWANFFVQQLTFKTNYGDTYGPYGSEQGNPFSIENIHCGGFFGKCGLFLDALGAFYPLHVS